MGRLPESPYDLNTYWGRVCQFSRLSSPFNLFVTNAGIRKSQALLKDYDDGKVPLTSEIWRADRIVRSSVHPDTGEIVTLPFRMSSYVLSNLVVTAGMLNPRLTPTGSAFWQWMNQSLNVAINSANANKSHPISMSQMVVNYFLAVGASVSVALGLGAVVPRLKGLRPTTRTALTRLVPFAAVVSAGLLNIGLMRSQEIVKGISVYDIETDENLGNSRVAAARAVGETALSRAINASPIMALPPLILYRLERGPLRGSSPRVHLLANLGLITITSFAVMPFAFGIFAQRTIIDGSKLEPEFAGHKVYFNRGV